MSDPANMDMTGDGAGFASDALLAQTDAAGTEHSAGRIGVILGIDLPVVVRFGRTEMPIRLLSQLGPGSVVEA